MDCMLFISPRKASPKRCTRDWVPVQFHTRLPVTVGEATVYIPTVEEQIAMARLFGRMRGGLGVSVVVVGAANSAVQIAHELAAVAEVTLATRENVRFFPQRMLGIDFHAWVHWSGLAHTRWLSDQGTPVLDDGRYKRALQAGRYRQRRVFQRVEHDAAVWADGSREPIDVLLFATGFRPNLDFLAGLPVQDRQGQMLQRSGRASQVPGLFFVGLPKQRNFASATLRGVGPDAAHLLPALLAHLRRAQMPALQGLA